MLVYVEGKSFLSRTFVLSCEPCFTVARVKALLLHAMHEVGRGEHYFRLSFADHYLREPLTLTDYNIKEMSVLQMVPISFGRCVRAQTAGAASLRPLPSSHSSQPHTLTQPKSVGAHTFKVLEKEVAIFKRRERLLETVKGILWVLVVSAALNFTSLFWWSGFWTGLAAVLGLFLLPSFVHVSGSVGGMGKRQKGLMVVYGVCFLLVALADCVMAVYLAVTIATQAGCPPGSAGHTPGSQALACGYAVWLAVVLYPLQAALLGSGAGASLAVWSNFQFQAGVLVEPTLTQPREVAELMDIAHTGRIRDKRQVAFELNNVALLGDDSKTAIAAAGGLQVLLSLLSAGDEVTQEYAIEALAELLSLPSIQAGFVSQGGVATLCALLHSANSYVVTEATAALSYLTQHCHGNRLALVQENGLDDILQAYEREPATARAFLHKILLDLAQCPHAQPALADHTHLLDAMATEIATCCDGGGGEEGLEERLFLAYVLAELADPYPTAVLERPQVIPGLVGSVLSVCDPRLLLCIVQLLHVFARSEQGSKLLLLSGDFLTVMKDVAIRHPKLALNVVRVIQATLQPVANRAALVSLGLRACLSEVQTACGHLQPDLPTACYDCLALISCVAEMPTKITCTV